MMLRDSSSMPEYMWRININIMRTAIFPLETSVSLVYKNSRIFVDAVSKASARIGSRKDGEVLAKNKFSHYYLRSKEAFD